MRVLAIDPGYDRLGVAVLEGDPSRPTILMSDCVIPPRGELPARLGFIQNEIVRLVDTYVPEILALETLFFSANKKTAIGVAQARGVVLAIAGVARIPVIECSPQQVKLAVTGHGAAHKAVVAKMLPHLLTLPNKKRLDDEVDAIAIGIAALAIRLPH